MTNPFLLPTMEMNRLKPTVLASSLFNSNSMKSGVLAGLTLLSAACSSNSATDPTPSNNGSPNGIIAGNLEVSTANNTVKLRNTTERQVGYMVIEKNQAIVAMFPPCATNCAILRQGESIAVPYAQIGGYAPQSTDAMVMWWKYAVRTDGSRVPEGSMQIVNIKLK